MTARKRVSPRSGRADRWRTGSAVPTLLPPNKEPPTEQLELDDIEVLVDTELESLVEDLVERLEDEVGPYVSFARRRPPWRPRPAAPSATSAPRTPWTATNLAAAFEDAKTRLWVRCG
jgi:hypothetical protein